MTPKSMWFPSYRKLAPLTIIPAITYLDQFYIIGSNLNSLINNSDIDQWNLLLSINKQLMDKKYRDSSNLVKLSGKNEYYWKYDKFAFFFMQYNIEELFSKRGAEILHIIRNELDSTKWIFANCRNRTLIFTLTSNHNNS